MGEELKKLNDESIEIRKAESELKKLAKNKAWQGAKTAVDAAGFVDPTPVSDAIGGVMSLAEGNLIGAGLSVISMIPYLGDAVGKTAKGARVLKKLKEITQAMSRLAKKLDKLHFRNRRKAAERVRKARRDAVGSVQECAKLGKWGDNVQLPTTGSWKPPNSKGHGRWTSDNGKYSVEYNEGFPDFSTAKGTKGQEIYKGKVEIHMTGNNREDFKAAKKEWIRLYGGPPPKGYTWHHKEDGVTVELVRSDVHDKGISGAAHTGGASIVGKEEF